MSYNQLFLPEIREMLAENDEEHLREFCYDFHPARTAEYIEGLTAQEIWELLRHCDLPQRVEIYSFLDEDKQLEIFETAPRNEIATLVADLPADDRVDILNELDRPTGNEILALLPVEDRRDISRLRAYPEGTCGSMMTSDFVRLSETMTVGEAIQEVGQQLHTKETVYYLYVLDEGEHLVGLVSAKQLLASVGRSETIIRDLMKRDLITVEATEDSSEAADAIARYDFLAVPVVDEEHRMLGIITYDDVIDVNSDLVTKHVHQMGAVQPMEQPYLETPFFTIWHKRVVWLACLFVAELFTFSALAHFNAELEQLVVLAMFIPLCISVGGNSGAQAATLVTRSLALGEVRLRDWFRVMRHEIMMGLALGLSIGLIGFTRAVLTPESVIGTVDRWLLGITIAQSVALICLVGTIVGSLLPLGFKRIGIDPAVASSPFVATFVDVTGIIIYFTTAKFWLLTGVLAPMVTLPATMMEFSLTNPTPEARRQMQEICRQELAPMEGVRFFYTTDTFPVTQSGGETMALPGSCNSEYQVRCVLFFKDENASHEFHDSKQLTQFLKSCKDLCYDHRMTRFEVSSLPER